MVVGLALLACNRDTEPATFRGTVTDKQSHRGVAHVRLAVENAYYAGGDYDSYNGYNRITVETDSRGRFSFTFPRSCYLQLETDRRGYKPLFYEQDVIRHSNELLLEVEPR